MDASRRSSVYGRAQAWLMPGRSKPRPRCDHRLGLPGSLPSEWGLGCDEGDMESCVHRTARYGTRGRYLGTIRKTQSWGDSWGKWSTGPFDGALAICLHPEGQRASKLQVSLTTGRLSPQQVCLQGSFIWGKLPCRETYTASALCIRALGLPFPPLPQRARHPWDAAISNSSSG